MDIETLKSSMRRHWVDGKRALALHTAVREECPGATQREHNAALDATLRDLHEAGELVLNTVTPNVVVKTNDAATIGPCGLCGGRADPVAGPGLYLEGSWERVCGACAQREAPALAALVSAPHWTGH